MRVRFLQPYFANSVEFKRKDGRTVNGVRYRAGVYDDVPDGLPLPKSAVVLDEPVAEARSTPVIGAPNPIHAYDHDRAVGEETDAVFKQAELLRTVKRGPGRPRKFVPVL